MCRYDEIMQMLRDGKSNAEIAALYADCTAGDIEVYRRVLEGRTCRMTLDEINAVRHRIHNFPVREQDVVELYLQNVPVNEIIVQCHKSKGYIRKIINGAKAQGLLSPRDQERIDNTQIAGEVLRLYESGKRIGASAIAKELRIEERRVKNILMRRVYQIRMEAKRRAEGGGKNG